MLFAGVLSFDNLKKVHAQGISENKVEYNSQNASILQAALHIDPNPAKGGGEISIVDNVALQPQSGVSGTIVEISERKSDQIAIYEVREGDSLSQIAKMFGVTTNTIRWANDFEGAISPGQTLIILPITGITHVVKSGGNIGDIAKIYDADIREIALFNGISVDTALKPGDKILVPNAIPLSESHVHEEKEKEKTVVVKSNVKTSGTASYSGYYMRPLSGGTKTQGIHGYNAVDIGAPSGTAVYASASGSVIISKQGGWNGGYGSYVVIKHNNGTQTLYAHLSSNIVGVGQTVTQGQTIGSVGNTGRSTGNHLHFEIRGAKNPF